MKNCSSHGMIPMKTRDASGLCLETLFFASGVVHGLCLWILLSFFRNFSRQGSGGCKVDQEVTPRVDLEAQLCEFGAVRDQSLVGAEVDHETPPSHFAYGEQYGRRNALEDKHLERSVAGCVDRHEGVGAADGAVSKAKGNC